MERNIFRARGCSVEALDCPSQNITTRVAPQKRTPAPTTRVDLKLGKLKVQVKSTQNIRVEEIDGGINIMLVE